MLDFRPLLADLLRAGSAGGEGAELFHGTLIAGLADWIGHAAAHCGHTDVVLGGGCLMNRVLAEGLACVTPTRSCPVAAARGARKRWRPLARPGSGGAGAPHGR